MQGAGEIILGDNLEVLPGLRDGAFQLIYIDPPFNTGKAQTRKTLRTVPDESGDRIGFTGRRYKTRLLAESSYLDEFDDYLAFLEPAPARRPIGCWRRAGPSTSTSITARRITASCCSTRSSAASAF